MKRPVQYFSDEYLDACKKMTPTQIARFLEDFRNMVGSQGDSSPQKLISLRVPENLLKSFRNQCELEGIRYQSKIKELMKQWVAG